MNAPKQHAKTGHRNMHRTPREITAATTVLAVLALCGAGLLVRTDGWLNQGTGVSLYIILALFSGIAFWAFTPSKTDATWVASGMKLAGGAATGMIFVLVAWRVVPPDASYVVIRMPSQVDPGLLRFEVGEGVTSVEALPRTSRLVVDLARGAREGHFTLRWIPENTTETQVLRLIVNRRGETRNEETK